MRFSVVNEFNFALAQESFVLAHEQLGFEILHSILHNADDDEHAGAAEHQSLHAVMP